MVVSSVQMMTALSHAGLPCDDYCFGGRYVGGIFTDFDPFADAISLVERVGSVVTSFASSFETVNYIAKLKGSSPQRMWSRMIPW